MGRFSTPPPNGYTRLCLDPWAKCFIRADGTVWLCCNGAVAGSLKDQTLQEIIGGDKARRYRLALLEGHPEGVCQSCPDKKIVPVQELIDRVIVYLETGEMTVF